MSKLTRGAAIVDFDFDALSGILRQDIAEDTTNPSYSNFTEEEKVKALASALSEKRALMIGGHQLSNAEYRALIDKLVRRVQNKFKETILGNQQIYRQTLFDEVLGSHKLIVEVKNYLQTELSLEIERMGSKLDAIPSETTSEVMAALEEKATSEAGQLVLPNQFFYRWLDENKLFNHSWSLEGRIDVLTNLKRFADKHEHQVAILPGRGGIGKTRLLYEFSKILGSSNVLIYFIEDNTEITLTALKRVSLQPCILIMDDAHRRVRDVVTLCKLVHERAQAKQPPIKLVLSTRPYAAGSISSQLSRDNISYLLLDELKTLSLEEGKALARQTLGEQQAHLAHHIATIARDSPLVIVVGGQLLSEKCIQLSALAHDLDFRREVLDRFEEVVVGKTNEQILPKTCRDILELMAAVAPVRIDNEEFLERAASLLTIDKPMLVRHLGTLEESGILLRRGHRLRITPDVLADHIFHKACFTQKGDSTGYARDIFEAFKDILLGQVLRNLAELDWQIKTSEKQADKLIDGILAELKAEFRASSYEDQYGFLEVVKDVAYYQPDYAIEIVQSVMRHRGRAVQTGSQTPLYEVSSRHLLAKLPAILRQISYSVDYAPICCDLLWQLGKDDYRRQRNNLPESISILREFAEYDFYKPLEFYETVLDAVERWLLAPDTYQYVDKLLTILDPLLEREAEHREFDGRSLKLSRSRLAYEKVEKIRGRAFKIIEGLIVTDCSKISFRALQSLLKPLRELSLPLSPDILREEIKVWEPEQLSILEKLYSLATDSKTEPLLVLEAMKETKRAALHSSSRVVREKASDIISAVEVTYQMKLTGALIGCYVWHSEADEYSCDWENQESAILDGVANAFVENFSSPEQGCQVLNERLKVAMEYKAYLSENFYRVLSTTDPKYVLNLCHQILEIGDCALASYMNPLLYPLRELQKEQAAGIVKVAIESEISSCCLSFAGSYFAWEDYFEPRTFQRLVRLLVSHQDICIKDKAIKSLSQLIQSNPDIAIPLALNIDTEGKLALLESVFLAFSLTPTHELSEETFQKLLQKLETAERIDNYCINQFLIQAIERAPSEAVAMLIRRIESSDVSSAKVRNVLPSNYKHENCLLNLFRVENYTELLKSIRDIWFNYEMKLEELIEQKPIPPEAAELMSKERLYKSLYKEASLYQAERAVRKVTPQSLALLNKWIETGDAFKVRAASRLVNRFPSNFVFSNLEFVQRLLEQADRVSEECYRDVNSNLWGTTLSIVDVSTVGQPSP